MPFHELLGAFLTRIWSRTGAQISPIRFAVELAIPIMRTAGYFQNVLFERIYGRKPTPAERLLLDVTSGWPAGANPFFVAFLSGFAYENTEELTEGWLSAFGQILLSPVVETDLEQMLRGVVTGDFFGFMDALAEWTSEAVGLETASAFFRGIKEAAADWESLTGIPIPTNWLAEFMIWLNATMRGAFDEPFDLPWEDGPGEPPPPLPDIPRPKTPIITPRITETGLHGGLVRRPVLGAVIPERIYRRPFIAEVRHFVTMLSFKGPRPSMWSLLQDKIPPGLRQKLLWLLMTGGGWSKMYLGPGGSPPGGDGDGGDGDGGAKPIRGPGTPI